MKNQRYILVSLLLAGAIVISFFESLIPVPVAIPGFKLGLGNIIIIIMIYSFSFKESFGVVLGRILIASLLRGIFLNSTFWASFSGGVLSFLMMYILFRTKIFGLMGISVIGAIFHTIGQIVVVIFWTATPQLVFHLPLLLILSIFTGIFVSVVAKRFLDLNLIEHLTDSEKQDLNEEN